MNTHAENLRTYSKDLEVDGPDEITCGMRDAADEIDSLVEKVRLLEQRLDRTQKAHQLTKMLETKAHNDRYAETRKRHQVESERDELRNEYIASCNNQDKLGKRIRTLEIENTQLQSLIREMQTGEPAAWRVPAHPASGRQWDFYDMVPDYVRGNTPTPLFLATPPLSGKID